MSKAFTRETDNDLEDDEEGGLPPLPAGGKNYIRPKATRACAPSCSS
jgi:transcription elongation factor GreB